ncbi:MAG: hypothetical protein ACJ71R_16850 [Nitrososphaeraceae archaeon]
MKDELKLKFFSSHVPVYDYEQELKQLWRDEIASKISEVLVEA